VPTDKEQEVDIQLVRAGAELASTREGFVLSLGALEREVSRTLDWREWVRGRPGVALGLAFGLGFILGRRR
jgi:hypothetical protein